MKLQKGISLETIAKKLNCDFVGDPNHLVLGINEIHRVEVGDLVFVDHPKYYEKALKSKASTIIINQSVDCPEGKALLISEHPFDDFNQLIHWLSPSKAFKVANASEASIHPEAILYPNVTIGDNVRIGKSTVIYPGVVILNNTVIGENVIIGPNTVIGSNAFYYKKKEHGFDRLLTCGNVVLEDNVELGAGCTIDAGVTASTVIGYGSKLDNQVHVGHDTIIGKHCLIAANVGIAGCVNIEDHVTLWGQVGCASDVTIGEKAVILAQSGISKSLPGNITYFGSPAKNIKLVYREMAALRRLPEILENL
ncbi:MAG: UDP-3-O-(3-hydroxymyristoyl)glucosamine N-acyltransferase [Crocinitomicaceae bacterium]|nr:UDP-3-O-(3-hydroxymyristoyl)glucosamine N-acyltransferase [Crocinitomicaceae bacterium]